MEKIITITEVRTVQGTQTSESFTVAGKFHREIPMRGVAPNMEADSFVDDLRAHRTAAAQVARQSARQEIERGEREKGRKGEGERGQSEEVWKGREERKSVRKGERGRKEEGGRKRDRGRKAQAG